MKRDELLADAASKVVVYRRIFLMEAISKICDQWDRGEITATDAVQRIAFEIMSQPDE